mmetsp:Transcript_13976/g.18219  ORF Transcript_13976/g.18219 Transcript_13976/m.18219 type:complete len:214 (-) Transcript_13976:357-998(-)|eukprot:CAMPEP_0198152816 /NCGR_PEP_ID=MMETSP1443-20131203/61499_1 /TAXON_ID=186043 /ORGANISM="Entomoneis sp., Strain CCMP2396" /LENGTH=213 /DNA_ID=CAMNT_0043818947 /DNA_START=108 /DNA_END=749 /DNA_ORIENTATION=-
MTSTAVFPNFRHSINDVPSNDWTVEEVFQWTLLQSQKATDERFDDTEKTLRQQLDDGVQVLLNLQKTGNTNHENQDPNAIKQGEAGKSTDKKPSHEVPPSSYKFSINVLSGNHNGKTYDLHVSETQSCVLGRSRGKKFRDNGVSLSKDLEVSTTHGKFAMVEGKLCFIDTGSTNGSKVVKGDAEIELDPDDPCGLSTGTILICGTSRLEINIR